MMEAPFKILVAEDNDVNQKVIRVILERNGLPFEIAADGSEAVRMFSQSQYDLVLMDCQMPQMDGLEATKRIRAVETGEGRGRCYIVAMTANAMKGDRERCLEAGMDDFLAKPFTSQGLTQRLKEWMARGKA